MFPQKAPSCTVKSASSSSEGLCRFHAGPREESVTVTPYQFTRGGETGRNPLRPFLAERLGGPRRSGGLRGPDSSAGGRRRRRTTRSRTTAWAPARSSRCSGGAAGRGPRARPDGRRPSSAFGFSAFGFSAFGFSAFGFSAFGFSAFGFSAFGFSALSFSSWLRTTPRSSSSAGPTAHPDSTGTIVATSGTSARDHT